MQGTVIHTVPRVLYVWKRKIAAGPELHCLFEPCTVVKRPSPDIVGQQVEGQVVAVDRFLLYKHGGRAQVPGDCQSPV